MPPSACMLLSNQMMLIHPMEMDKEEWAIELMFIKNNIQDAQKAKVEAILLVAECRVGLDPYKAAEYIEKNGSLKGAPNVRDAIIATLATPYDQSRTMFTSMKDDDKNVFGDWEITEVNVADTKGNIPDMFEMVFKDENNPVGDA